MNKAKKFLLTAFSLLAVTAGALGMAACGGSDNSSSSGDSSIDDITLPFSEGLEFTLNEDGESYSVTGIGDCTDTEIIIPTKYQG